ncbi:esterase [Mycobacterium sp. ITM-2017-0098]|nr:esterase [Mycobacterium sp. ITM-2017-0098]
MQGATHRRTFLTGGLVAGVAVVAGAAACARGELGARPPVREPHVTEHYRVFTNLEYAAPADRGHLLDLYLPLRGEGLAPVVIFQKGSAFKDADTKGLAVADGERVRREDPRPSDGVISAPELASLWVPRGYAVVGLNVRSSSQVKFPGQVHDAKAAIRYLRAHAAMYGLNPQRFATMGNSSGAWVSTMAALTSGVADLEGDLGHPEQSSAVSAVIDLFGPTDFLAMDAHRLPDGEVHDSPLSPESTLMGFPIQRDPAAVEKANPATYVGGDSPPAFITHGTGDPLVPSHQSEILFEAYEKAGATATLALLPGVGHTDAYLFDANYSAGRVVKQTRSGVTLSGADPAPTLDALLAFLETHLRA